MKNNKIKIYATTVSIVAVLLVIFIIWQAYQNITATRQTIMSVTSSQSLAGSSSVQTTAKGSSIVPIVKAVTTSMKTPTLTPVKQSSANTYANYLTQYDADLSNCNGTAAKQNSNMYPLLDQSSFTSYYNTSTGVCYEKLTGVIVQPYSTTTTGAMYFRNVTSDDLVMECTDSMGMTLASGDWQCVDKTNDQTINLAEFNALLYKYTTQ